MKKIPLDHTASCRNCRLKIELCLCANSPHLDLKTRVVVFMHQKEFRLVTNTGTLAHRILKNSQIVFRGNSRDHSRIERSQILPDDSTTPFVLFPAGEAIEITPEFVRSQNKPITLICPDGHWAQAKKILRHEPAIARLPCVKLPSGLTSNYRLRKKAGADFVCTFEAISLALGLIEGQDVQEKMLSEFNRMVTRLLWTRGRIKFDQIEW